jgi:hypothetical protein
MRSRYSWPLLLVMTAILAGLHPCRAGEITLSHGASALPGAPGPAITLLSITGDNDGTDLTFTLTFANPTVEGPSSGNNDAVYGFINIDTDKNSATGVTGAYLDSHGYEPGFGQYSPSSQGIDAYINLSSEGDPLHGAPGLVDLVTTNGFNPIDTIPVTYKNNTLSLSIPLSDFSNNNIPLVDTGDFSVVVGNVNNATDFLPSAVPEPGSILLLSLGMSMAGLASIRLKRWARAHRPTGQR